MKTLLGHIHGVAVYTEDDTDIPPEVREAAAETDRLEDEEIREALDAGLIPDGQSEEGKAALRSVLDKPEGHIVIPRSVLDKAAELGVTWQEMAEPIIKDVVLKQ